jgi:hypothetical protein
MEWLTIISVLSAAVVSVVSVFVPVWLEKQKSMRDEEKGKIEAIQAEIAEIQQATSDLLEVLAMFRFSGERDLTDPFKDSSRFGSSAQAASTLQHLFYLWEMKVWGRIDNDTQAAVEMLRKTIEDFDVPYKFRGDELGRIAFELPKLSSQIINISRKATIRQ